jgi:peptidoglycan/LPS O-acetylase OafA/YrhL
MIEPRSAIETGSETDAVKPAALERPGSARHGGEWIPELDGLRALASLAVVLAHYNPIDLRSSGTALAVGLDLFRRLSMANLGVVFFYTLSAFLLTYLALREYDRASAFAIGKFYLRRCFRIWPLYFTLLTVDILMARPMTSLRSMYVVDGRAWSWILDHLWMYLGFVSNWSLVFDGIGNYVDRSTPPLAVMWSIAVEEQFYLFYPVLLLFALSSSAAVRWIIAVMISIGLIFRFGFVMLFVSPQTVQPSGGMYYATLAYTDVFVSGAIGGWLFARGFEGVKGFQRSISRPVVVPALGVAVLVFGLAWGHELWRPRAVYSMCLYGLTGILFTLVIISVVVSPKSLVPRFLRSAPLRILGTLSFGMYLWHTVVNGFVQFYLGGSGETGVRQFIVFSLYLAGTVVASALTYTVVERPVLRLKDTLIKSPRRFDSCQSPHAKIF